MRFLVLLPAVFAINTALPVSAAPMHAAKVVPVPVLGAFTLGLIGPTNIPNIGAPNAHLPAGVPVKRALHGNPTLRPRMIHNADYGIAPTATAPITSTPAPMPDATAAVEKRARASPSDHKVGKDRDSEARKDKSSGDVAGAPSLPEGGVNPASAAQGVTGGIKAIGAMPKQDISPAVYSLPLEVPDTPVTQADALPVDEQAPSASPAPAPGPKPQPQVDETPADPNAYSSAAYPSYAPTNAGGSDYVAEDSSASTSTTTAAPPQRRHDLVFDMDPIIPPSDGTKVDPRMGFINLDSNRKAEPHDLPKHPQVPADVPAPDVPGDGSLDPAYPDVYHAPPAAPKAPVTPAPTA